MTSLICSMRRSGDGGSSRTWMRVIVRSKKRICDVGCQEEQ